MPDPRPVAAKRSVAAARSVIPRFLVLALLAFATPASAQDAQERLRRFTANDGSTPHQRLEGLEAIMLEGGPAGWWVDVWARGDELSAETDMAGDRGTYFVDAHVRVVEGDPATRALELLEAYRSGRSPGSLGYVDGLLIRARAQGPPEHAVEVRDLGARVLGDLIRVVAGMGRAVPDVRLRVFPDRLTVSVNADTLAGTPLLGWLQRHAEPTDDGATHYTVRPPGQPASTSRAPRVAPATRAQPRRGLIDALGGDRD